MKASLEPCEMGAGEILQATERAVFREREKSSEHWLLATSGKVCGLLGTAGGLGYYLMVIKGLKNTESKLHLSNSFAGVQPVNVTKSKCRKGPKSLRVLRVTLQKYCVRHLQVTDVTKPRSATL